MQLKKIFLLILIYFFLAIPGGLAIHEMTHIAQYVIEGNPLQETGFLFINNPRFTQEDRTWAYVRPLNPIPNQLHIIHERQADAVQIGWIGLIVLAFWVDTYRFCDRIVKERVIC